MSENKSSAGKKILKVFLFILVICGPIIILMLVFTPFASKKITKRIVLVDKMILIFDYWELTNKDHVKIMNDFLNSLIIK